MKGFVVLGCVCAVTAMAMGQADDLRISLPQHRISVVVPGRWQMTYERVNGVGDPVTLFTASTFPVRVRPGDRTGATGICSKALLRAWRPEGAYVQLAEERDGASRKLMLRRVPKRPRHFTLTAGGWAVSVPHPTVEILFQEGGRAFYVVYGIGAKASRATHADAAALLDSLRIAPRG